MTDIKLLPCPFCGGDAQLDESEPSTARFNEGCVNFLVTCKRFECTANTFNSWYLLPHDAAKAWNTRVDNPSIDKCIEHLANNHKELNLKQYNELLDLVVLVEDKLNEEIARNKI